MLYLYFRKKLEVAVLITQKKIAELAGVSRGTVDRVLNGRGEVGPETRDKILEIAHLMNYKPNRAGKTLVIRQKNLKIGCIMIQADNPFYADLNRGIQQKAEEYKGYGIEVIVKSTIFKAENQIEKIDELLEEKINALVIQPANEPILSAKLQQVTEMGIPVVTTNTDIPGFKHFCYIGNDFYACGNAAANLMDLITHGCCKIGVITGFVNAKSHSDRVDGFRDYIRNRPDMQIVALEENHDDELESYSLTQTMLEQHPEIDALFIVAGGVYGAGRALKLFLQHRTIRAISFDDVPTTKELVRDGTILATICQQPVRQGELSLEVLFNYFLDQQPPEPSEIFTDIQIKIKANIDI
jgi:LacI family transcriptional regulator